MRGNRRGVRVMAPSIQARARTVAVVTLVGLALSAPGTQAGPAFSPPQDLSEPEGSILHAPAVAMGTDDVAMAVWSRNTSEGAKVEAVRIGADGTPGPVLTLSESTEPAWSPKIAVDSQGRATAVWYQSQSSGPHRITAVQVSAGDVPGPVRTLSADAGWMPEVVVDSKGRATVVWYSGGGASLHVQGVRLDEDGNPGPVRTLSALWEGGFLPRAAVDSQDRVTVVWSGDEYVQSVRIGADGVPEAVWNLSDRTYGQGLPDIAVDSADRMTAVWQEDVAIAEGEHENDWRRVKSVRIGSDGEPEAVRTLSGPGQALGPKVAIDSRDRAVVVWEDQLPRAAMSVRVGADGSLEAVRVVGSASSGGSGMDVAADRSDGATVVWDETLRFWPTPDGAVRAVRIGAVDAIGPLQTLSTASDGAYHESPALVVDSLNRVTVVWKRSDGLGGGRVQMARGGDAVEPTPSPPFDPSGPPPPSPPFDPSGPPPPSPPFDPSGPPPPSPPFDPSGPPPPSPPLVAPAEPAVPSLISHGRLRLAAKVTVIGRRALLLRAACNSRYDCAGRLTIVGRRFARGDRPGRLVVLARARYRMAAGTRGVVVARLSRHGRELLQTWRRPTLVVLGQDAGILRSGAGRTRVRLVISQRPRSTGS